jgi:hypothetical protein
MNARQHGAPPRIEATALRRRIMDEFADRVAAAKAELEAPHRRGPSTRAPRPELEAALEEARSVALPIGSAWDAVPWAQREPLLDQALSIEEILTRGTKPKRGPYRPPGRRVVLRHPDMDLDNLGAAEPAGAPRTLEVA